MPIRIQDSPDPGSPTCLVRRLEPHLIGSEATRQLSNELEAYCRGDHNGRAFLIAGHRGAGKTTLVYTAHDHALHAARERGTRPVLVLLQGPTLLPPIDSGPRPVAPREPGADLDEPSSADPAETLLREVVLTLYNAVVECVIRELRRRLTSDVERPSPARGVLRWFEERHLRATSHERQEVAAQLQLELDEYPSQERLTELWERAGLVERGLFQGPDSTDVRQGLAEIVALISLGKARRLVSGKLADDYKRMLAGNSETKADVARSDTGDGLKVFYSVLAGGAVGAGAQLANSGATTALFSGALTGLGALWTLKYSASQSRRRSLDYTETFIPDRSVATLERVLPQLIEQLRVAGLSPVFVVDELDKVENLAERLARVVPRLKKLVAERAFFCFLVDREYFEHVRALSADHTYAHAYTFFTHQLFVCHAAAHYHTYLREIMGLPEPGKPLEPKAPGPSAGAAAGQHLQPKNLDAHKDLESAQVFPFLFLHRAQMHPIALKRELAAWRDQSGHVRLSVQAARSWPVHRCELRLQISIELVLDSETLASYFQHDPAFRRVAHDALYYPSRQWERGEELDLSDEQRPSFEKYLLARMLSCGASEVAERAMARELQVERLLTASQRSMLFDAVRRLAALLATTSAALASYCQKRNLTVEVTDAVMDDPLLSEQPSKPLSYRWSYDRAGMELGRARPATTREPGEASAASRETEPGATALGMHPAPEKVFREMSAASAPPPDAGPGTSVGPDSEQEVDRTRRFVDTVEEMVRRWSDQQLTLGELANSYYLIGTAPEYGEMRRAQSRLSAAQRKGVRHDTYDRDFSVLRAYEAMLERDTDSLGAGLLCAHWLTRLRAPSPTHANGVSLRDALGLISDCLRLNQLPGSASQKLLGELCEGYARRFPEFKQRYAAVLASWDQVDAPARWELRADAWQAAMMPFESWHILTLEPPLLESIVRGAWMAAKSSYVFDEEVPSTPEGLADLTVCRTFACGPSQYLTPRPEDMTCRAWSAALVRAWATCLVPLTSAEASERWVFFAALRGLGLRPHSASGTDIWDVLHGSNSRREPADDSEAFLVRALSTADDAPRAVLLVLFETTPVQFWAVDERVPVLIMSVEEVRGIAAKVGADWPRHLGVGLVAGRRDCISYVPATQDVTRVPVNVPGSAPGDAASGERTVSSMRDFVEHILSIERR